MTFKPADRLKDVEISLIRQWNNKAKPDTINLGIGQLGYEAPFEFLEAGKRAFESVSGVRYTTNAGLPELRSLVAEEHKKNTGRQVNEKNVIITCGVQGAIFNACFASLNPGDEVLLPEIFFSPYATIPKMLGAKPITFKLEPFFGINLRDLESKITDKTKIVVLNSPSNPTGSVISARDLEDLAHILKKHENVYVLSDEIYSNLYFTSKPRSIAEFFDRTIVTNGISKRASAGARIGWTIAPEEVTAEMLKAQQYTITCAPTPCQYAAIPVLKGDCRREEEIYRERLKQNRDFLFTCLRDIPGVSVVRPEGAFYLFPNISKYGTSEEVSGIILERENVLTMPGKAFVEPGNARGDRHIRISYAVDEEVLRKGAPKIKEALLT